MSLFLAWFLPVVAGTASWLIVNPRRTAGWLSAAFGHGIVFGMLITAAATSLFARNDTQHAMRSAGSALAIFAALASIVAWRRMRAVPIDSVEPIRAVRTNRVVSFFLAIAFVSIAWRLWIALREILLRPTFPWDAWDAWAVKSKAWFMLGHYVPFVAMKDWIATSGPDSFTGVAWSYPSTLGWIQVWFASAAGGWVEPIVNLPWFALWIGLLFAHYGQWRALGLSVTRARVAIYLFASLPLITVHVALAGYADLWVAAVFGFAVLAWMRWLRERDRGQLFVFVCCVLLLPLLKLEGAVWLLLFAIVAVFAALRRPWRKYVALACAALLLIGLALGKLILPLLTLGWVHVAPHTIEVPVLGPLAIAWHSGAFGGTLRTLFEQPNWNLLWWVAPVIVVARWRELRDQESLRLLACLLVICIAFLMFLFLFTDAARFAESFTAINRLVMHVVPALITMLALLLRDAVLPEFPGTAPASDPRSNPA
ncbi:MAG: hypothetical protein ABJB01_01100 [Rudaea sp.]